MDHRSKLIVKIANEVYRSLGSGFSEDVYDRAMQVGLRLSGIRYESQKVVELKYKNYSVGEGYPDLLLHFGRQRVVVELKAVSHELGECEERQLKNYMKVLEVRNGMLVNFRMPGRQRARTRVEIREVQSR